MLDVDTFLTTLYAIVDDFCHSHPRQERHPGPDASLSPSEVVTLAIFARWSRSASERDSYRYADGRLRDAFPTLPDRSQFNRLVRRYLSLIEAFALRLVEIMEAREGCPYEAPGSSAMPVRDAKRRGAGWLAGRADIGWSNRLGWYEGFRLLVAVNPVGVVTGLKPSTGVVALTTPTRSAVTLLTLSKRARATCASGSMLLPFSLEVFHTQVRVAGGAV